MLESSIFNQVLHSWKPTFYQDGIMNRTPAWWWHTSENLSIDLQFICDMLTRYKYILTIQIDDSTLSNIKLSGSRACAHEEQEHIITRVAITASRGHFRRCRIIVCPHFRQKLTRQERSGNRKSHNHSTKHATDVQIRPRMQPLVQPLSMDPVE